MSSKKSKKNKSEIRQVRTCRDRDGSYDGYSGTDGRAEEEYEGLMSERYDEPEEYEDEEFQPDRDFQESDKPFQKKEDKRNNPLFAYWKVGNHTYRLKLKTKSIEQLERQFKTNLVNLMGSESGMPSLKVMLTIAHEAMKEWHHGIRYEDVMSLFDRYIEEGGSQLSFYTEVFMMIYIASGFFSGAVARQMMAAMRETTDISMDM